jgi:hypothetical protein
MRSTELGCFRSRSWSFWKALNEKGLHGLGSMTAGSGLHGLGSMTAGLPVQKFLKFYIFFFFLSLLGWGGAACSKWSTKFLVMLYNLDSLPKCKYFRKWPFCWLGLPTTHSLPGPFKRLT